MYLEQWRKEHNYIFPKSICLKWKVDRLVQCSKLYHQRYISRMLKDSFVYYHMYKHIYIYIYIYIERERDLHIHTRIPTYTYIYTNTYTYIYTHFHIYVCVSECVCIYHNHHLVPQARISLTLSPLVSNIHRSRQVFQSTYCIFTALLLIGSSSSPNSCSPV